MATLVGSKFQEKTQISGSLEIIQQEMNHIVRGVARDI